MLWVNLNYSLQIAFYEEIDWCFASFFNDTKAVLTVHTKICLIFRLIHSTT